MEPKQRSGKWENVEYIRIISMTDKFNQPHRPVTPEDKIRWATQYESWKKGQEVPAHGQPLKTWPGIQPAEVNVLAQSGVHTVEALAAAPDSLVGVDGPYLSLRDAARRYLELSTSTTALQRLEAEAAQSRAENESLRERLAALEKRLHSEEGDDGDEPRKRGPGRPRKSDPTE